MRKVLFLFIAIVAISFTKTKAQTITPIDSIQTISATDLANGTDLSYRDGDTMWIQGVSMFDPCNYAQSGSQGYPQRLGTFLMNPAGGAWKGVQIVLDPAAVSMTNNKDSVVSLAQAVGFTNNFQYGTLVKCKGIVSNFGGNTQFSLLKVPSVAIGPSTTPSPMIATIDTFEKLNQSTALQDIQLTSGEKYEGTYVQINNPIITNVSTATTNRYRYDIKDAAGNQMVVQDNFSGVFSNTNYDMFCTGNNGTSNTPTVYTGFTNGTVITYIRGFIGQYLNSTTGLKYYSIAPLKSSDIGVSTYAPPTITNIHITPGNPTPSQTVNVLADVTDDSTVANVKCYYAFGLNSTNWSSVNMTLTSGSTYSGTIPSTVTDSVWVKYYIKATDNFGHASYAPDSMGTNNWYLSIQRQINKISDVQSRAYGSGKSIYTGDSLVGINIQGIVTATNQQDDLGIVTIQDGTNKYSGIALSGTSALYLHRGEKIQITAAKVNEVSGAFLTSNVGMTTLANPTFTIISANNPLPSPITTLNMDSIHLNNSNYTEPYEAMLIGFNNIVVSDTNPDFVTNGNFGEWAVYSSVGTLGVRCDDYSNDIPSTFNTDTLKPNDALCYVDGIVQYSHGNWKMLPRNRADICGYATNYIKSIDNFVVPNTTNMFINQSALTITMDAPAGTNVTNMVPAITFRGMTVSPATNVAQDFTNPVAYTVTAANNTTKVYNVSVAVASGINGTNALNNLQLFPNPANDVANIVLPSNVSAAKTIVHVQTIAGINMADFEFSNKTEIKIPTTNLANGIYLVVVENGSDKKILKLSIAK